MISRLLPGLTHTHIVVRLRPGEVILHGALQILFTVSAQRTKNAVELVKTIGKIFSTDLRISLIFRDGKIFFLCIPFLSRSGKFRHLCLRHIHPVFLPQNQLVKPHLLTLPAQMHFPVCDIHKAQADDPAVLRYLTGKTVFFSLPGPVMRNGYLSLFSNDAVHGKFIADVKGVLKGRKIHPVFQKERRAVSRELRPHRADNIFIFPQAAGNRPVRKDKSVHTEVSIVFLLPEIAAVQISFLSVLRDAVIDRMIAPLPDTAAENPGLLQKKFHIGFQIAGSVPHGVAVLTQKIGTPVVQREIFPDAVQIVVHPPVHIQHRYVLLKLLILLDALVVEKPCGIVLFHPSARLLKRLAVAGLIAQRPHDDAGPVLIPDHIQSRPVKDCFRESRIFYSERHPLHIILFPTVDKDASVGFQVALADDHKPVRIAKFGKPGRVWIVTCPDGIDIVRFHQPQIPLRLFPVYRISRLRITVMPVYSPQFCRDAVQINHSVFYLNSPESRPFRYALPPAENFQAVQIRILRIPQMYVPDRQFAYCARYLLLRAESPLSVPDAHCHVRYLSRTVPGDPYGSVLV